MTIIFQGHTIIIDCYDELRPTIYRASIYYESEVLGTCGMLVAKDFQLKTKARAWAIEWIIAHGGKSALESPAPLDENVLVWLDKL